MDTQPDPDIDALPDGHADPAFREFQAIRCLEAAVGMLASPCRTLTCAEIGTLQSASRRAANPQLRTLARMVLDLWADEREPAVAAMLADAAIPARELRQATGAEVASILSVPRREAEKVLYFDPFRDRAAARRVAEAARARAARRETWDPLGDRPCDTEEPVA